MGTLTVNAYLLGLRTHVLTQNIDSYRQNIGLFVYTGTYISVVYSCSSYRNYLRVLSHYIGTYRHIRVLRLSEVIYRHTGTCITLGTNYRRLITDIRVLTVDAGRADHVHDGFIVRIQLQGLHQGEYVIHVNVDFSIDCDQLERCLNGWLKNKENMYMSV